MCFKLLSAFNPQNTITFLNTPVNNNTQGPKLVKIRHLFKHKHTHAEGKDFCMQQINHCSKQAFRKCKSQTAYG